MKEVSCINSTNMRRLFGEGAVELYGQFFNYNVRGTKFGDIVILNGNFYAVGVNDIDNEIIMASKNLCLPDHLTDFLVDEFEEAPGFLDFGLILHYESSAASARGYLYRNASYGYGDCAKFIADNF